MTEPRRPVRIANCSGFYGDRLAAAREMVDGGPIDVLCGDYLAELTMLILAKAQAKDPALGYARTFLTQAEEVLGTCLERGVRIVANAGGLNPGGLAEQVRAVARALGLTARVAHVEGDDLRADLTAIAPPVEGKPLSANAYLGGWGITSALRAGADVVVTGRVADASLVTGPAAWWHGWEPGDWDRLAGAAAAGHVIECGPQVTGGNYCFLDELPDHRLPGFPLAEVAADGGSVITKHPHTGGVVSTGTVTAQLLYEIAGPAYAGPDVTTHLDSLVLTDEGADRVRISGARGTPPPPTLKVALNDVGGFRNTVTFVLTGLDVETKAAMAEAQLFDAVGGRHRFAATDVRLMRFDAPDARTNEEAVAHLRVMVKDPDARTVGRAFSNAAVQLALAGYPGVHTTAPPADASAFGVYRPARVDRDAVVHRVLLDDGSVVPVADPPATAALPRVRTDELADVDHGATRPAVLGSVVGARSGDKGGDANVGLWARDDASYRWLRSFLTVGRVRALLGPEAEDLEIDRYMLPNLRAVNVVVHGLLGDGVASSTRPDPQAKGLGEYLRSRVVDVPVTLLSGSTTRGVR